MMVIATTVGADGNARTHRAEDGETGNGSLCVLRRLLLIGLRLIEGGGAGFLNAGSTLLLENEQILLADRRNAAGQH